jgi:hypothetical protein
MKRLLATLLLALGWASAAWAQPADPSAETIVGELTATPLNVRAGEDVAVTGIGCAPGNEVRFDLYNPELRSSANARARGDGTFVASINLASTTKVGRTWLRATCLTPDSEEKVMEAVLLVSRPEFVVTWTNIFFGAGTALVTAGIGLTMLKQPGHHHSSSSRSSRRKRRRHRGVTKTSSGSKPAAGPLSDGGAGPSSNGTRDSINSAIDVD